MKKENSRFKRCRLKNKRTPKDVQDNKNKRQQRIIRGDPKDDKNNVDKEKVLV